MGNLSLKYIYPSFNQMLGAMTPLITVALAVVFQRKRYNFWTWLALPIICGGLAICGGEEVNFHWLGALFASGAAVMRAVKSILQGILLQTGEKMDSVTLLYYMAPWSAAILLVLGFCVEGLEPILFLARGLNLAFLDGFGEASSARPDGGAYFILMLLFVSGMNACLLNVANFAVTAYTNAVTLQVLGNVKNCLSIAVSVAVFGNALSPLQAIGVGICLFGVWLYSTKGKALQDAPLPDPKSSLPL